MSDKNKSDQEKRKLAVYNALKNHSAFSDGKPLDASMPNIVASIMGKVAKETLDETVGDNIDRGLILLRKLNEAGFNVSFDKDKIL